MKNIIFTPIFLFIFCSQFKAKSQCQWDFENCIDCELEIELCWHSGGTPVCTTFVLAPGCLEYCTKVTLTLPADFCSGSGGPQWRLIRSGANTFGGNPVSFNRNDIICCGNAPYTPDETHPIPPCISYCECAEFNFYPNTIPRPKAIFQDLTDLYGLEPCLRSTE